MTLARFLLAPALAAALAVVPAPPVGAAANGLVAHWEMNEPVGATTLTDTSGNGIHGAIGSAVATGTVSADGSVGYYWDPTRPNEAPAKPERLVTVDDGKRLASPVNPGTADYAVTVRYRTTAQYGNLIQKGQSGSKGGYWKLQQPKGILACLFRGVDGSKAVNSGVPLNTGEWHTVRCERIGDTVKMTITFPDGTQKIRRGLGVTGSIGNAAPLTIGGKLKCDQVTVTCDYFSGHIDYVKIQKGA